MLESAQDLLAHVVQQLTTDPYVSAVLVREPLLDLDFPATSDLDLMVIADVEELLPERLVNGSSHSTTPIDVIRLPRKLLHNCEELAQMGLVPHRLLSSRLVHDKTGKIGDELETLRLKLYEPKIHAQRLTGFLEMGFYTVREIGVTWDFPALALFWLHVGHAACVAAIVDGHRQFCANVYTRPLAYCRQLEAQGCMQIVESFVQALFLDTDVESLIAPLRRMHRVVHERFPEPDWPSNMRQMTRYEYRYFGSGAELDWRISVAREMARCGNHADAVFYLRFWAYSLARLPMVYHRALEGIDVSFMRPECKVLPDLQQHCPEILEDLSAILGPPLLATTDINDSLGKLYELRELTLSFLKYHGIVLAGLRPWQPASFTSQNSCHVHTLTSPSKEEVLPQ